MAETSRAPLDTTPMAVDDDLIGRWQQLDENQQEQVITFLAERRAAAFAWALDIEKSTRPEEESGG